MDDKQTFKQYLDYFGNKSAEADMLVQRLTRQIENQRFGTIRPKKTLMQKVMEDVNDPQMQMMMGLVEPGSGLKTVGKGVIRGGKNMIDILREALGIGRKEMGDVLSGYKRGVQPDVPVVKKATEGQQALELTPQELPAITPEGPFKNLFDATGQTLPGKPLATPKKPSEVTFEDLYNKIAKQMDEAAQLTDDYDPIYGKESVEDIITDYPEDFVELLRRAIGREPSTRTKVDFAEELIRDFGEDYMSKQRIKPKYEFNPKKKK